MPSSLMPRPLLLLCLLLQTALLTAQAPSRDPFPGFTATKTNSPFPGFTPVPISATPLNAPLSVISLEHRNPDQISDADHQLISNLSPELSQQAALANFDISSPAWHYQQIMCPAFPDYVLLAFTHGADESGSSHFGALLPRNDSRVRILTAYSHGLLPFEAAWNRPGSYQVFNGMLRQQRGATPVSYAQNWLMIAVCFAELSGSPVQVLSALRRPDLTMDLLRLDANQPQMVIAADQSADITFSDVSRPTVTAHWTLHFDRHGQITSAAQRQTRQASAVALKP